MKELVLIGFFLVCMCVGQVSFKLAAQSFGQTLSLGNIYLLAFNQWFLLMLAVYAVGTCLWVKILQTVDLSKAYCYVGVTFIVVPLIGYFLFKEPVSAKNFVGMGLIFLGVLLVTI